MDVNTAALARLDDLYDGRIKTFASNAHALAEQIIAADLVIGATLSPGKLAPKLISKSLLARMRAGSVLVDISVDQGGIAETSRPTSHSDPIYVEQGVVHYCVPNMPAAVARTATLALTQATLPYVIELAQMGLRAALAHDRALRAGLQVYAGHVTHEGLAQDVNRLWTPYDQLAATFSEI
jgi:alanine dehydrogenase